MRIKLLLVTFLFISLSGFTFSQTTSSDFKIARVKYSGGGDWYNDPSSEVNLLNYVSSNTNIKVNPVYEFVDLSSDNVFLYPVLYLTGHGNLRFSSSETIRLEAYLKNGGFLIIDDDYGLDKYIRAEMKKVFSEQEFVEIPFSHGIYSSHFKFEKGLPKIHEHDDKVPQCFGLFHEGRLCVVYFFESNPGDGWADPEVHKDPPEKREAALKIGTNVIVWALTN